MGLVLYLAIEVARQGEFHVRPGVYSNIKIPPLHTFLVAYGTVQSSVPTILTVPVYRTEHEEDQIGTLEISFSSLDLKTSDLFNFEIGPGVSITFRIASTKRMKGAIKHAPALSVPDPIIIGHRGSGVNAVNTVYLENSIPSYLAALKSGASTIEIDVRLSKDDVPVIIHDDTVTTFDSQCTETVPVSSVSAETFKDSGLCTPFKIDRPLLKDVFDAIPQTALIDVELKLMPISSETPFIDRNHLMKRVIDEMETSGGGRTMFLCTFDPLIAAMCAFSQSKYPVFFLAGLPTDDSVGDLDRLLRSVMPLLKYSKVHGLILNSAFVVKSPGLLRSGISAGMRVITWGIGNVDEEGVALQITEGVSGFVTDDIKLTKDCILSFVHRPN